MSVGTVLADRDPKLFQHDPKHAARFRRVECVRNVRSIRTIVPGLPELGVPTNRQREETVEPMTSCSKGDGARRPWPASKAKDVVLPPPVFASILLAMPLLRGSNERLQHERLAR